MQDIESRKQQFLGFIIILLIIGFLNYFRKISTGYNLTRNGKILYLATMITFTVATMFVLYYSETNNIISFLIGLLISNLSEHIAKLFILIGNNFIPIIIKIVKKIFKVDLTDELCDDNNK